MLRAESSLARDWNTYEMPNSTSVRQTAQRPIAGTVARNSTRTVIKIANERKFYMKSALLLFGYALVLVFLAMQSSALGYQIEKLEVDIQSIETANHRLDYEIAEKSSLDRVEQIAAVQLGMYKPASESSLAMAVRDEPIQVAAADPSNQPKNIGQKLFSTMYNSLSRLAQNDK